MVGKAGYLIESGEARPDEILMLAFGKQAASEMEERVENRLGIRSLKIKTFHSLGLEIIGIAEGKKPTLSDLAEDEVKFETFIGKTVNELKRDQSFRSTFIYYFLYGLLPVRSLFDFKSYQEYIDYCKQNEPRTLQGESVRSYEELAIANFLFRMGVQYQYESPYKIDMATAQYRQYTPDFYLPESGIYIEHFALDTNGMPPSFMDQQKYLEGVKWKRTLHWQHGTRLLETYSHEQASGVLLKNLEEKLQAAGVKFDPVPEEKLLDAINSIPEASEFTRLLAGLLKAFKLARWKMAEFVERAKSHLEQADNSLLIKLFRPVYERYQSYLEKSGSIDFEDMINRAIEHVVDGTFRSPYRFILVDEFQDISGPRADLIKGLLKQNPENSLFCVGDDWQAIYRFTGSDVSFTKKFDEHFGSAAVNALDTTYRFNDKIGSVASRFVQSNPDQIKKTINSLRTVQNAAVTLVPSHVLDDGLTTALTLVDRQAESGASVLLLARFKFKLPANLQQLKSSFPRLKLHCMTVHASKGKEADYVIVLGMDSGKFGFPSEKATPPLLDMLLPTKEKFAFAEERRLFYVALTRARHHVYLLGNPQNCSVFIRELRTFGHEVEQLHSDRPDAPDWSDDIACPSCMTGYLIRGRGRYSRQFSCSNQPYCEYTEQACRECGGVMRRSRNELACRDEACGERLPLCPKCGGTLQERKGARGVFWGCSNYRGDDPGSCRYTARGKNQSSSWRHDEQGQ
jgi:DNA helicase-4